MYGNTEISMISLFGLGDISRPQYEIRYRERDISRPARYHGCGITWYDFFPKHMMDFLKTYHTKSLRFTRHHTQLPDLRDVGPRSTLYRERAEARA